MSKRDWTFFLQDMLESVQVGLRNRLAHASFAIDDEIVWDIVTNELPLLKERLERILREVHG